MMLDEQFNPNLIRLPLNYEGTPELAEFAWCSPATYP